MTIKQVLHTIEQPRTLAAIQWNGSAVIWPDDNISLAVFRERLQFFALNASDEELKAFAALIQV